MKVGFFDSGVGGLNILWAFHKLCPGVATEYIADSENCPYGNKPAAEIVRLSEVHTKTLLSRGCGIVVVACNTATAAAIDYLRTEYPEVQFVGIEPAIKPAALKSKSGIVGVLATAGTFNGRLYNETKARFAKNVTVLATVADEFVEMVEKLAKKGQLEKLAQLASSGRLEEFEGLANLEKVVARRIDPLLAAGADKIVLGCTHFPHLKPVIEKVCAGRAEVVDPSDAVARRIKKLLEAASRT